MYKRFQNYLNNEFKGYPETKEVKDFKDELLGNLVDRAEGYKSSGIMDEDKIFEMCVCSINGFKDTLKVMKSKPILIKGAKTAANLFLYFVIYLIALAGVYLAVSFTIGNWNKTWLILAITNILACMLILIYLCRKAIKNQKFIVARLLSLPVPILFTVAIFLLLSVLYTAWGTAWVLFLSLPATVILADLITASIIGTNRIIIFEIMAVIIFLCVLVYVVLAWFSVILWHPFWLIPVGGVIVSLVILAVNLKKKIN